MVLNAGGLFQGNNPALDSNNRTIVAPDVECTMTVAGGTSETGNIFLLFDNDVTTLHVYHHESAADPVAATFTTTLNFIESQQSTVLWVYYGAHKGSVGTTSGVLTLQKSINGTTWTDLDSITLASSGSDVTTNKNFTIANTPFKYLRFSYAAVGSTIGLKSWDIYIYEIFYVKK